MYQITNFCNFKRLIINSKDGFDDLHGSGTLWKVL